MRLLVPCIAFCASLCGCATQVVDMQWMRADGKPVVETEIEAARTVCAGEVQKAGASPKGPASADLFRICMNQRGYIQQISQ
jgi:hypothetical protein